jgi:hypothetical protein
MSAFHTSGIIAVWNRQVGSLLGNPLGYLFILAFVLIAGAFLFLPDAFYSRNIADLGPLHGLMPWLLVVLLPALAMGSWSSERELGTEELLLTLPLSVADAVIGKFLAVATYFTIALLCSLSNVAVLMWLGNPDLGLVFANYLGWWLAGLAFAAVALIASVQVSLPAIAFVLGVIYCAIVASGAHALDWFDPFDRGQRGRRVGSGRGGTGGGHAATRQPSLAPGFHRSGDQSDSLHGVWSGLGGQCRPRHPAVGRRWRSFQRRPVVDQPGLGADHPQCPTAHHHRGLHQQGSAP